MLYRYSPGDDFPADAELEAMPLQMNPSAVLDEEKVERQLRHFVPQTKHIRQNVWMR